MTNDLPLPPALRGVITRTRQVGLHKVANVLTGCEPTLPAIAQHLGAALYKQHVKFATVNTGLADLQHLANTNVVPLEKEAFATALGRMAATAARKGWSGLGNLGARAGSAIAQRPVLNRMGQVDAAIAKMPGLTNVQRGAMTQQWLPAAENAMTAAGNRGAQIGKNVAQGGALVAGGAALGAGMRGSQQPQY